MEKRKQPLFENYVQVLHGIKFIWPNFCRSPNTLGPDKFIFYPFDSTSS